jgi:IS4 transposase
MARRGFAERVVAEQDLREGTFDRIQANIDPDWIEEALEATGTATLRRRRLPAEQVIWLVLGMALYRNRPIDEIVAKLDLALPGRRGPTPAPSAVAQARRRLGEEPMRWLFERCSEKWAHESARRFAWRGLALYGVDGTTARVPDSLENRHYFGGQLGPHGDSAYPVVRIVTLMTLRTHLLAAARFGPYARSETIYARSFWPQVPDQALVIADCNFFDAKVLIPLNSHGVSRHWLVPAKANFRWRVIRQLGSGDDLVEMNVSTNAQVATPTLPNRWEMRAIRYERRGFRPRVLLTSLTDSDRYPAAEIASLYHERWEMELGYDEVKTEMLERQEAIRSRSPAGVGQELWGVALAYSLVRLEMVRIAEEAKVAPTQISFVMALRLIRDEWLWCAVAKPGAIQCHSLRRPPLGVVEAELVLHDPWVASLWTPWRQHEAKDFGA